MRIVTYIFLGFVVVGYISNIFSVTMVQSSLKSSGGSVSITSGTGILVRMDYTPYVPWVMGSQMTMVNGKESLVMPVSWDVYFFGKIVLNISGKGPGKW